ncbi:hypothetical protein CVV43_03815 [Candidatus Saccharibacteria bacterium HGW-Saccharibacteria-1]|jgi:hypothetical protein|nr:MAG: hypothetical protein CVV43_03815 [Candidatus Saccharibacteria bacterium HGW-Saccharibacteria-1]
MKRILRKIRKQPEVPPSSRITSETVAHHRERILAGGRRFKYPVQYARHKLVFNAILISLSALIVVLLVGWWQLYKAQNTSEFMYRITKVMPMPIASIDGRTVLYSDYLLKYRSSVHYLEQKEQVSLKTDDGKRQVEYIKQQSMRDAIADAYAAKLAKNMNISISSSELEGFLKEQRQSSDGEISQQTYDAVILDYYGWSPAEYKHITEGKLLRQKVSYAMDKKAISAIDGVSSAVKKDPKIDFKTLATTIADQTGTKAVYGTSGWVPKNNQDGGLSNEAAKLTKAQSSKIIKSTIGDGYYVIRLIDINDAQVSYEYVKVPLTAFTESLDKASKDNKVKKYIAV